MNIENKLGMLSSPSPSRVLYLSTWQNTDMLASILDRLQHHMTINFEDDKVAIWTTSSVSNGLAIVYGQPVCGRVLVLQSNDPLSAHVDGPLSVGAKAANSLRSAVVATECLPTGPGL
jgi:uncharacterized protein (UPF0218 family)